MEKFDNIQKNNLQDEELDQISGGRAVIGAFTTEFRGGVMKPTTLEMDLDEKNQNPNFGISTLELKDEPVLNRENKKPQKTIKL